MRSSNTLSMTLMSWREGSEVVEAFEDSSSSVEMAGTSLRGEAGANPAKPDSDPVCMSDPVWVDDGVHSADQTDAGRAGLPTSPIVSREATGGSGALPLRHPPLMTELHSPNIDWNSRGWRWLSPHYVQMRFLTL